jgi:predicted NAD-dependent protein-ADP-ribosyltransferase YbiA (DUF1768 family)
MESVITYQYFGSGAGMRQLSNFYACNITGTVNNNTYIFPSVEHYYVAHLCQDHSCVSRLAVGGDLSTIETGMGIIYHKLSPDDIKKKITYWKKYNMVGIIAKMYGKMINRQELPSDWDAFRQLWVKILTAKYTQNEQLMQVLISTGYTRLVEFDRMASPHTTWAGRIVNGIDRGQGRREGGELIGKNYMGDMMTYIRNVMRKPKITITLKRLVS